MYKRVVCRPFWLLWWIYYILNKSVLFITFSLPLHICRQIGTCRLRNLMLPTVDMILCTIFDKLLKFYHQQVNIRVSTAIIKLVVYWLDHNRGGNSLLDRGGDSPSLGTCWKPFLFVYFFILLNVFLGVFLSNVIWLYKVYWFYRVLLVILST